MVITESYWVFQSMMLHWWIVVGHMVGSSSRRSTHEGYILGPKNFLNDSFVKELVDLFSKIMWRAPYTLKVKISASTTRLWHLTLHV